MNKNMFFWLFGVWGTLFYIRLALPAVTSLQQQRWLWAAGAGLCGRMLRGCRAGAGGRTGHLSKAAKSPCPRGGGFRGRRPDKKSQTMLRRGNRTARNLLASVEHSCVLYHTGELGFLQWNHTTSHFYCNNSFCARFFKKDFPSTYTDFSEKKKIYRKCTGHCIHSHLKVYLSLESLCRGNPLTKTLRGCHTSHLGRQSSVDIENLKLQRDRN